VCDGAGRGVLACVPAALLARFAERLRAGRLDGLFEAELRAGRSDRVLASVDQTTTAGVYDRIGDTEQLTPTEWDPRTGRPFGSGGSGAARRAKRRDEQAEVPRRRVARRRVWIAAAAVVAAGALAAVAVAASGGGDGGQPVAAGDTSTSTSTTVAATTAVAPTTAPAGPVMSGTYDADLTVVESENPTAPVGTKETRVWTVEGGCSAVPCTFSVASSDPGAADAESNAYEASFDGATVTLDLVLPADCFDPATGERTVTGGADAIFHVELTPAESEVVDGVLVATRLTGTLFVTGEVNSFGEANGCSGATVSPFTYDVVAVRR
jgi:hypothetical protein